MISTTRKRIIIFCIISGAIFLLIRYLLFDANLLNEPIHYHYNQHKPGAPVVVEVFYEALCPDSKHFINKQLIPAYVQAAPLMTIQLIPYGKAETFRNPDGSYRFDCQHGPPECEANTYHACVIEAIEDTQKRLDVVGCMIKDNRLPKEAMHKCSKQNNVDNIDNIQKCYDSGHGSELLAENGDKTHALRPIIRFIPTITLDGSQGRQASILKDLLVEICKIIGDNEQSEKYCKK